MDLRAWFLVQQWWNRHEEEEKLFLYETRTVGVEQRRNRKNQRAFDQQRAAPPLTVGNTHRLIHSVQHTLSSA